MKTNLSYFLFFSLLLTTLVLSAQPQLQVTYTDNLGTTNCDQSDPGCSCNFILPVQFGEVEALLERTIEIDITNSGGSTLAIDAPVVSASTNWNITYSIPPPWNLNSTTPTVTINATFNPQETSTVGPDNANLTIHSFADVGCFEDLDMSTPAELEFGINLLAEVKKTIINYSLVLDRSGSMSIEESDGLGGNKRRIDLLQEAANYFLGLEYLRVQTPSFDGDKIGIVKYNNTVDATYLPFSTATTTFLSDAQSNQLATTATTDNSLIGPVGGTATGNAVISSINDHLSTEASGPEKNVIILFSDGYENVGSLISDTGTGSVSSEIALRPDINIYSIGMGSANMGSLEAYSGQSGLSTPQAFYYDPSLDPMALTSFFFKIYQNAVGLATIVDPTYYADLSGSDTVNIATAQVSSSDLQITISITYPSEVNDQTTFRMITPSGKVLDEGAITGLQTRKVDGSNHDIYQVTLQNSADPADYVGEWKLIGFGSSANDQRGKDDKLNLSNVPVGFAVSSLSNVTMDGTAEVDDCGSNELVVTTEVDDSSSSGEVMVDELEVQVTRPDGKKIRIKPEKDRYGVFRVQYPQAQKKGIYDVAVRAKIINAKGEVVSRESLRSVVVSDQKTILAAEGDQDDDDNLLTKITLGILILILLLMLILLLRNRKDT